MQYLLMEKYQQNKIIFRADIADGKIKKTEYICQGKHAISQEITCSEKAMIS